MDKPDPETSASEQDEAEEAGCGLSTIVPGRAEQQSPELQEKLAALDKLIAMTSAAVDDTKFVLTVVVLIFTILCLLMRC